MSFNIHYFSFFSQNYLFHCFHKLLLLSLFTILSFISWNILNLFSILCLIKCLQFLQFWFCCLLFLLALTPAALFCVSELIFICGNTWGWDEDKFPERGFAFESAQSLGTPSTWEHSEINFRLKVLWPTYIGSMSSRSINFHEGRLIVKFSREIFFSSTQNQGWNRQNFLADSFSGIGIILFRSYAKLAGLQSPSFMLRSPIRLPIFNIPRISFLNLGLSSVLVNTLKLALQRGEKKKPWFVIFSNFILWLISIYRHKVTEHEFGKRYV